MGCFRAAEQLQHAASAEAEAAAALAADRLGNQRTRAESAGLARAAAADGADGLRSARRTLSGSADGRLPEHPLHVAAALLLSSVRIYMTLLTPLSFDFFISFAFKLF